MKSTNEKNLEELHNIAREGIIENLAVLMLTYYHHYKNDGDSLFQIFHSMVDIFILPDRELNLLFDDVIKRIEDRYFYKVVDQNSLKIESVL